MGETHITIFITGKARVSLLKQMPIPRLELEAEILAVRNGGTGILPRQQKSSTRLWQVEPLWWENCQQLGTTWAPSQTWLMVPHGAWPQRHPWKLRGGFRAQNLLGRMKVFGQHCLKSLRWPWVKKGSDGHLHFNEEHYPTRTLLKHFSRWTDVKNEKQRRKTTRKICF